MELEKAGRIIDEKERAGRNRDMAVTIPAPRKLLDITAHS
jgi:hypothetical protein